MKKKFVLADNIDVECVKVDNGKYNYVFTSRSEVHLNEEQLKEIKDLEVKKYANRNHLKENKTK